jgi:opine dehydrogenase
LALAAYLSQHGHAVALWNRSAARTDSVAALGGIRLTMPGATAQVAPIAAATSTMSTALKNASVVLVAVPASGHADIARACAPHLRDGQTVLLLPGRTGGALEFQRVLHAAGCHAEILLGEANTFPFAARNIGPAEAMIFGTKAEMLAAALPAKRTSELVATCRPFLPMLAAAPSVLHTGLSNLGAILHPTIVLANAERIERGETFDFYQDGVTQRVADVLAAADEERLRVAASYGVSIQSLPAWIAAAYGHHADSIKAAVCGNPAYAGITAPSTLQHRYLLEDMPTGLIPLVELGEAAGLVLPTLHYLISLARVKLAGALWQNSRTLDSLGLAGLNAAEIRARIVFGSPRQRAASSRSPHVALPRVPNSASLIGSTVP